MGDKSRGIKKPDPWKDQAYKNDILYSNDVPGLGFGASIIHYVDVRAVTFFCLESHCPIRERIQGEVLPHANVAARVEFGASLAYDDVSGNGGLATEEFYPESFTLTVPAVVATTYAFLMCHCISSLCVVS